MNFGSFVKNKECIQRMVESDNFVDPPLLALGISVSYCTISLWRHLG